MQKAHKNLTGWEQEALAGKLNLADAHTHQGQSLDQVSIVNSLPNLWFQSEQLSQHRLEQRFISTFFFSQNQPTAIEVNRTFLSYSCSVHITAIGYYLSQFKKSVCLIEPCFDNLPDLLKRHHIPLHSISECMLTGDIYENLTHKVHSDALFLVDPNNPTGFSLFPGERGERHFLEVLRFCRERKKLLILDLSFAPFAFANASFQREDIYHLLEDAGVSYITLEDTGKAWPVQDAKCSLMTVSADLHSSFSQIQSDILLNVSPFILNVLIQYLELSIKTNFEAMRVVYQTNHAALIRCIAPFSFISYCESVLPVCVSWLKLTNVELTQRIHALALQQELFLLPGDPFYWNSPFPTGDEYLRIALARKPKQFESAMHVFSNLLNQIQCQLS